MLSGLLGGMVLTLCDRYLQERGQYDQAAAMLSVIEGIIQEANTNTFDPEPLGETRTYYDRLKKPLSDVFNQ